MKIYTKTGDNGTTSLYGGKRLSKDNIRIEAYGTVDELNSWTGLVADENAFAQDFLRKIQVELFNIGSHLASDESNTYPLPEVAYEMVQDMEEDIDRMNEELEPLKTFILPGGSPSVSHCHIARTVCRRAERRIVTLTSEAKIDEQIVVFLNRYSDYLFILSRYIAYKLAVKEIPWEANIKR